MSNIAKIKLGSNDVTNIYFGGYQTKNGIRHLYTQECWNVKVGDSAVYSKEKGSVSKHGCKGQLE